MMMIYMQIHVQAISIILYKMMRGEFNRMSAANYNNINPIKFTIEEMDARIILFVMNFYYVSHMFHSLHGVCFTKSAVECVIRSRFAVNNCRLL